MKCTNCGAELTGKFCTVCGTPAPEQVPQGEPMQNPAPEQAPQAEPMQYNPAPEQVPQGEPMQYNPAPEQVPQGEPMQYNPAPQQMPQGEPVPYSQPQQYAQPTQPRDFSQQYQQYGGINPVNQGGYTGQQFTNQPNNPNLNPQGKQPMSTGKIVGIVLGIVGGVILLICILIGVVACNVVNTVGDIADNAYDIFDEQEQYRFEIDDFMSYDNDENTITFGGEYTFVD